jgi:hypothetical protein
MIEAFPDNPPEFLTRTPYAYNDVDQIQSELERAGFSDISIDALETITSASTACHPAIAMIHGTPLRNEIEERDSSALESVTDRATAALAARFGEGPISASIRGYVVVAR